MKDNWIIIKDLSKLPEVTPMLVYGWCCDACYQIIKAEVEDGEWFESSTGEDLTFTPTHYQLIEPPTVCANCNGTGNDPYGTLSYFKKDCSSCNGTGKNQT